MGSDDLHLVHMGNQRHSRVSAHATPPTEEERPAWRCEDTVNTSNVVQDLVEEEDVQLLILTT